MTDATTIRAFLDDDHIERLAEIDAFVQAEIAPLSEPADDDAARQQAREVLRSMGEAGWYGAIEAGDLRGCCLVREAVAWGSPLADAVFALQGLGSTPIALAGSSEMKDTWFAPAMVGSKMAAFAMTEPNAGSDITSISSRAVRDGNDYVIDGEKTLISNAGIADFYTVFASTDPEAGRKGLSCFVVPAETPGLSFVGAQVMSAPHPLGRIRFDGCRIPEGHRLGEEGAGLAIGMATLDRLRPTVGAAACGMAARALQEAIGHARGREQFGKALSEFQLIQGKLATMAIDLAAARLLVYRAAWEKDGGKERINIEAAMSKAFATEAAQRIIDEAVQIHGGVGLLKEHVVDRLYRSIRSLRVYEGTTEIQKLIIAGHL